MYAKRNYEKYLSALKNSGLVSLEDKGPAGAADSSAGAGTGALGLLGKTFPSYWLAAPFIYKCGVLFKCFCTFLFCPILTFCLRGHSSSQPK